jgi:hypothetical protein
MNYREAKDIAVSELTDPIDFFGASFGFCFSSDCVPQPDVNRLQNHFTALVLG